MKNMKKLPLLLTTCLLGLQGCGPTEPDKRNITLQFSSKNFGLQPSAASQSPREFKPIYIYLKITGKNELSTDNNEPDGILLYQGVVNLGVVGSSDNSYLGSNAKIALDSVDGDIKELEIRGKIIAVGVFDDEKLCRTEQGAPPYDITNIARRFYQDNFMDTPIVFPLNTPSDSERVTVTDDNTINVKNVTLKFKMKEALNKFAFKMTDTDGAPASKATIELYDPDSQQSVISPCTGTPYSSTADSSGRVTVDLPVAFEKASTPNFQVKVNLTKKDNDNITRTTTKFFDLAKINEAYKNDNHLDPVSCSYSSGSETTNITVANSDQMKTPIFWKLNLARERYSNGVTTPMELNSTPNDPNDPNSSYLREDEIALTENGSKVSGTSVCSRIKPTEINPGQNPAHPPLNPRFADLPPTSDAGNFSMDKLSPTIQDPSATPVVVNKANANYQIFDESFIKINGYDLNPSYDNSFTAIRGLVVKCVIIDQVLKDDGKPFNDSPINIRGEVDLTQGGANISKSTFYDCTQLLKNRGPDLNKLNNGSSVDMIYYFTDKEGYDLYSNNAQIKFYTWDRLLLPQANTPRYPSSINPYTIRIKNVPPPAPPAPPAPPPGPPPAPPCPKCIMHHHLIRPNFTEK